MEYKDLPFNLMRIKLTEPRQEAFDLLQSHCVPEYIIKKYQSPEDRADAFEGAFTAFHINEHLSNGADKESWFIEVLGFYDICEQKNFDGPFFEGLRVALSVFNRDEFYRESLDYIITNKGKLD